MCVRCHLSCPFPPSPHISFLKKRLHDWAFSSAAIAQLKVGACTLGFELFASRLFRTPDLARAVPFATVQGIAKSLHLYERCQVVVQARIRTLMYVKGNSDDDVDTSRADSGEAGPAGGGLDMRWIDLSNAESVSQSVATPAVARRTRSAIGNQLVDESKDKKKGKGPASKRRRKVPLSEQEEEWDFGLGVAAELGGSTADSDASAVLQSTREYFAPIGPLKEVVCQNGVWVAGLTDINAQATMEVLLPPTSDWNFKKETGYARRALLGHLPDSAKAAVANTGTDRAAILAAAKSLFARPVVVRLDICRVAWNSVEAVAVQVADT